MRKIKEYLSIIIIRDAGPRHSFRVHRRCFYAVLSFFFVLPLLAGIVLFYSWKLWYENNQLRENMFRLESDLQTAQLTADRLENLQELLHKDRVSNLIGRGIVNALPNTGNELVRDSENAQSAADGSSGKPFGQEEFSPVSAEYLKVDNVRVWALRDGKLRLSLDLHNTDSQKVLSGTVRAALVTADGERQPLSFVPDDVGDFKISRFKRAVMVAVLPERVRMTNAQAIIEVRTVENALAFRNIFAVER
ncbi:MAG: hypothetical protein ZNDK_0056 [Candidatus Desulfovibrio kirbyi]|uniref:Uncharacterized protein n=1 Tax=Candidatus Desulfovibrio kirbyi TaxID=2696086 RepID=A0A6L2R472_9BACT|nr:MAG: hypothetical protein ZNDK_0056 [Candidatus Desulfovibrio kirbyi]